ncbi:Hypothetical predicted protein [Marmota monax]|uniref:Alpha-N-acetylgalactosaminide alpha-2,6-sialyltransferase 6 n=1 Tax=Marmota monax TaxID=9995 RepID=A0A5E4DAR1_MARMO|nr:Hypothetical predicted protein [Marmota monax]
MSSNKEQRSAVFLILFALITILILYSSNSANEVFHYGSLRGRTRRPINLKKWSLTHGYIPILGNKTLPSRCHQCVIVTSSSHLLGTKLGPEIERAECTIRMNDAPTTGYSADVGNKTTFRVVAHSSVFRVLRRPQEFVNRTPETVFIFWGPPSKMQKPQGSLVRVIERAGLAFPAMEAYAVSPARMQQFDDLFRGETGKDRYQPPTRPLWPALRSSACSSQRPQAPACTALKPWSLMATLWSGVLGESPSPPSSQRGHLQHVPVAASSSSQESSRTVPKGRPDHSPRALPCALSLVTVPSMLFSG